jgi:hypothetical protein
MVDLTSYAPPGVYVEDISQDIVVPLAPGIPENLLCIVAPALGYQTAVENLAVYSATATALQNAEVSDDVVLVLRTLTGTLLVKDTDYSTSVEVINNANITKILRLPIDPLTASPAGVVDGEVVQATYTYTETGYYTPQRYSDYISLSEVYGPSLSSVPGAADPVISPLSLAAKIAFENGAGEIIALAVENTSTWLADFSTAYDKLVTDHRVSVLVVVIPETEAENSTDLIAYLTDLRLHCDGAAANGFGRTVLTGGNVTYDEGSDPYEDVALATVNKRIVVVYPTRYNLYNPNTAETVEVGACYAAAALGGRLVLNAVEKSLTRQVIRSFDSIPASVHQAMTLAFKNNLSASGVCVIETDRLDRLVVRHAVTTDMAALNTREISLVRIADVLSQNIQVGLDSSGLIGDPIDDEMTVRVKGALLGLLERAIMDNVIVSYAQVLVRQQVLPNGDPSVIECQFAYKPAVPLNYITVKFTLNLTTGVIEPEVV